MGAGVPRRACRRVRRASLGALLSALALCGQAAAAEHVKITASFSPYRLGDPAAMTLGLTVSGDAGRIPAPLTGIDMRYPANLGIATSGLGTASCTAHALELRGPAGCPADSIIGKGTALARFMIGPEIFNESASVGIVAAPSADGFLHLLVSATGISPVAARIVMASELLGGHFSVAVPLVPSLPEGEDVAVVAAKVTIGGRLRYTERRHGRTVAYTPKGIILPGRCPRGGFRFSGRFTFMDATSTSASTVVSCPRRR
jgi:hypothetical protein